MATKGTPGIGDTKVSEAELAQFFRGLGTIMVRVGIDKESATLKKTVRDDKGALSTDLTLTLGEVAAWNEFGTPTAPARNAFTAAAKNPDTAVEAIGAMIKALRQKLDAKAAWTDVAEAVLPLMKAAVGDRIAPPNAPRTVKRKGFDDPLEDTEQLFNELVARVDWHGIALERIEGEKRTARAKFDTGEPF